MTALPFGTAIRLLVPAFSTPVFFVILSSAPAAAAAPAVAQPAVAQPAVRSAPDTTPPPAAASDTLPDTTDTLPGTTDTVPVATVGGVDVILGESPFPRTAQPVSLDEAIEIALRRNPQLRRSRTSVDMANYDRLSAYGSYLPDLSLGYGFSDASTARLDPTQQSITRTSYTLQLGASVDVFTGFRRMNQIRASRLQVAAEEESYREERFRTVESVKTAYFDAVAMRELVRVEEARVERQRDQLDFARAQLELGRATRSDILRSRVDLNNARLDLLNTRNDARAASFRLSEVLGVEQQVAPEAEARLEPDSLPYDRDRLVQIALTSGPSLEAAKADTRAAKARVESSKSSYLPNLTFSGGWAWQNSEFPPQNRSWSFSLQGRYPLFNGFDRETSLLQAQTQVEAAEAQQRAAELSLRAQVDEAYSTVQSARAGMELAEQTVELTREDLRVTRERYRLGLASILDLQAAQINLEQAEVDLVERRFDYQMGVARLEALLGQDLGADVE